jgi:hypothetical protein
LCHELLSVTSGVRSAEDGRSVGAADANVREACTCSNGPVRGKHGEAVLCREENTEHVLGLGVADRTNPTCPFSVGLCVSVVRY